MTDITDQDKRDALAWAEGSMARGGADAAARVILATVDAPEPTLAEVLRHHAENAGTEEEHMHFTGLADDALEMEQSLYAARAEVRSLTEGRTFTAPEGATRPATDLPDPADVKPGEAWYLGVAGVPTVGFKVVGTGWTCYSQHSRTSIVVENNLITLVSRLVPAPRQITTRGELNALPEGTVVRAKGELVCERYRHRSKGLVWISTGVDEDFPVDRPVLPATVLWTPEETK